MGVLAALGSASALVFSLVAGVIVDRMSRRPIMIGSDFARAALLGTVPLAAALHRLTYAHVVTVAALAGILTVLFDVAYQSFLPSVVAPDQLADGNRVLGVSSAAAEVLGPGLTGVMIRLVTAPLAILVDAASFLVSAFSVLLIRTRETRRAPSAQSHWLEEALEGAKSIRANRLLVALAMRSIFAFFAMGLSFSLYMLYAIRTLRLSTVQLGFTIALGGVGALLGAWLAERISLRLGAGRAFLNAAVVIGISQLFIPLASLRPRWGMLCLGIQQLVGDFAWGVYAINELTLRQRITPPEVLGRVNAAMQIASRGILPLGALAGGFIASAIGVPAALWIGATGVLLSAAWLWPVKAH